MGIAPGGQPNAHVDHQADPKFMQRFIVVGPRGRANIQIVCYL